MRPISIPNHIFELAFSWLTVPEKLKLIKRKYALLRKDGPPQVSIVIPAYNEEKNILDTLHSLVLNQTRYAVQVLVVNNNSTDNTRQLVLDAGVDCIDETVKGITAARNAGLAAALGTYILNADADALYPPHWIELMTDPLELRNDVALTYGRFSFLPTGATGRFVYFLYEHVADVLRLYNKHYKEEAVNVYGFNSGFRRLEGLQVQGFNHPPGANEDGYLALKLRQRGYGKLHYVTNSKALVWTGDRRIQIEGGFLAGLKKRCRKYLFPKTFVQVRTDL